MYNPSNEMGSDSDLEWVEIFNNGNNSFNLTGFSVNGKKVDSIFLESFEYTILSKELIDGSDKDEDSFQSFYSENISAVDTQSFSLSNSMGEIIIENGNYSFFASYNDSMGGDGNGYSLEFVNNSWLESKEIYGTPGRENTAEPKPESSNVKLEVYLDSEIYTNYLYTKLFKIKLFNKKCADKELIEVEYILYDQNNHSVYENKFVKEVGCSTSSNTGSILMEEAGEFKLCGEIIGFDNIPVCKTLTIIDISKVPCDLKLDILNEKMFYQNGEKIKYYTSLDSKKYPYLIEYWIEDLLGTIIKKKSITTNTNQKTYTPKIQEIDRVLMLRSQVYPLCADLNVSNNYAEQMIIVTNPQINEVSGSSLGEEDSKIEIIKINPKEQKFGGLLKVDVEIYHGSTGKYSISAYAEKEGKKISEVLKMNLKNKFTSYKLTLPLLLKLNCDNKIDDGNAKIIIEGLSVKDEEKVVISGLNKKSCGVNKKYREEEQKVKKVEAKVVVQNSPSSLVKTEQVKDFDTRKDYNYSGIVVYESSSEKAKGILPLILIFSVMILIYTVIKKR